MSQYPTVTLNDDTVMPQLGLGVWKAEDGDEVENAVAVALKAGYRLIDTAMVYQNEAGVGRAIKQSGIPREELFITTKLWNNDQGAGKVRPALEASLKRLGLNYVDLYLIHWPMPNEKLYVETWKQFDEIKNEGLARSIGVSNFEVTQLEELKNLGITMPSVNQIELHPNFQQRELREYGHANGIKIESWSPIGGSKGNLLKDTTLVSLAEKYEKSPAQIVIRWHLQHGLIVIPKSTNDSRIKENFDVLDFELTDNDMGMVDGLETGVRSGPDPASMNLH